MVEKAKIGKNFIVYSLISITKKYMGDFFGLDMFLIFSVKYLLIFICFCFKNGYMIKKFKILKKFYFKVKYKLIFFVNISINWHGSVYLCVKYS